MSVGVEERVQEATREFIDQYWPTLKALEHTDLGHKITWVEHDRAQCSCGEEWKSQTAKS
jgi:hypothetical protein